MNFTYGGSIKVTQLRGGKCCSDRGKRWSGVQKCLLVSRLSQSQCNCACVPEDGAEALTTQRYCSIHVYDRLIKPQPLTRLARLKITRNQISEWVRPTWQPAEVSESSERQEISYKKQCLKDNDCGAIPSKVKCCHTEKLWDFFIFLFFLGTGYNYCINLIPEHLQKMFYREGGWGWWWKCI